MAETQLVIDSECTVNSSITFTRKNPSIGDYEFVFLLTVPNSEYETDYLRVDGEVITGMCNYTICTCTELIT